MILKHAAMIITHAMEFTSCKLTSQNLQNQMKSVNQINPKDWKRRHSKSFGFLPQCWPSWLPHAHPEKQRVGQVHSPDLLAILLVSIKSSTEAVLRVKMVFKAYCAPICSNNSDGKLNLFLSMLLGEHEDLMKTPLTFLRIFRLRFSMKVRCLKIYISKPGQISQNTFLQFQAPKHYVKLSP